MKNSIKIAFVAAIAAVGMAACTSAPNSENNAAPTSSTPTSASSQIPPPSVVTEVVTQTVTNPPKPQAVAKKVDNRPGYGALKLGMTLDEARATGMIGDLGDYQSGCASNGVVAISKKHGVERITLPRDAKTSAGIGVGATYADVKRAYPNASEFNKGYSARITGAAVEFQSKINAYMPYKDSDTVDRIKLLALDVDCSFALL
ncbi:hypothetical protein ACIA8G_34470 [Lentzea sp. NPDC051213]|uniref:hypothetical protein n=1 Tax=Lentzea sp. NPDC051213 TaxID=3364126 RepID=UPI0037AFF098